MIQLLDPGSMAPAGLLRQLTGEKTSLASLRGDKPLVAAFMKVSCPVCQMTFPFLDRVAAAGTLDVIGIGQDHAGALQSFCSKFGIRFPMLMDSAEDGYPTSNAFGLSHVPTVFLIEPGGEISLAMEGFSKVQMLELGRRAGMDPFLPGEYVPEWKSG
ncbi:MAG: TlpA disulfide reductase family protein [Acidobacteria bacterium]|nr:TlpA disulfide reductase family protein [Acidobacteriota bacterium]